MNKQTYISPDAQCIVVAAELICTSIEGFPGWNDEEEWGD